MINVKYYSIYDYTNNKITGVEEMSETSDRLKRLSGFAGVVSKIILALLVICVIVSAILLVITVVDLSILPDAVTNELTERQAQYIALNALAVSAVALAIMYYVQRLFTDIHGSDAVFTEKNVNSLRSIALTMVVAAVVMIIVTGITYIMDPMPIINGGNTLLFLLMAFIVYIISLIFQHGAELQRQSDETL